jgi:hydroxyacylglutathione hydrolase
LATNPFLRCKQPEVQQLVAQRLGSPEADTLETFAELRRWKDTF